MGRTCVCEWLSEWVNAQATCWWILGGGCCRGKADTPASPGKVCLHPWHILFVHEVVQFWHGSCVWQSKLQKIVRQSFNQKLIRPAKVHRPTNYTLSLLSDSAEEPACSLQLQSFILAPSRNSRTAINKKICQKNLYLCILCFYRYLYMIITLPI